MLALDELLLTLCVLEADAEHDGSELTELVKPIAKRACLRSASDKLGIAQPLSITGVKENDNVTVNRLGC